MKKVSVKFTVFGQDKYYYATTHKTKNSFLKDNGFDLEVSHEINCVSIGEQNRAYKVDRGVWCVDLS